MDHPACLSNDPFDEPQGFEYPTMAVEPNDAASSSARSAQNEQEDDAHSTTSDSTFEIISHHTSDDEESHQESESVASFGGAATDDASSIADTEESSRLAPLHQLTTPVTSSQDETEESEQLLTPSVGTSHMEDSSIAARTVTQSMSDWIEFEESPSPGDGDVVEAVHTIPTDSRGGTESTTVLTMRQSMTSQSLKLFRPFRILYYGDSSIKDQIVEKIAQAIASTTDDDDNMISKAAQKLNIVSIPSFSKQSPPQVTLIPSTGMEIEVVDNTGSKHPPVVRGNTMRLEKLKRTEWVATTIAKPDLAIVTHNSSKEAEAHEKAFSMWYSAKIGAQGVPTLDVSSVPDQLCAAPFGSEFKPYRNQAVHMCKEVRDAPGGRPYRVLERFPLDIGTFMSLDPHQMNRNIACLTGLHFTPFDIPKPEPYSAILKDILHLWIGIWQSIKAWVNYGWKCTSGFLRSHVGTTELDLSRLSPSAWPFIIALAILMFAGLVLLSDLMTTLSFFAMSRTPYMRTFDPATNEFLPSITTERVTQWITVTPTKTVTWDASKPTTKEVQKVELGLSVVNPETGLSKPMAKNNKPFKMLLPKGYQTKLLRSDANRLFIQLSKPAPKDWHPSADVLKVACEGVQRKVTYEALTSDTYEVFISPTNTCEQPLSLDLCQSNSQRVHKTIHFPSSIYWPNMDVIEKAFATSRVPEHFTKAQAALFEHLKKTEALLDQLSSKMGSNIADELSRLSGQSASWSRRGLKEVQELLAQARQATDALAQDWKLLYPDRRAFYEAKFNQKKDDFVRAFSAKMESVKDQFSRRQNLAQTRVQNLFSGYQNPWGNMDLGGMASDTLKTAHNRAGKVFERVKTRVAEKKKERQEKRKHRKSSQSEEGSKQHVCSHNSRSWKNKGSCKRCSGRR